MSLTKLVEELSQAISKLQAQPIGRSEASYPAQLWVNSARENIFDLADTDDSLGKIYAESLHLDKDLDTSLRLLAKTIDSLEADIEDKLFAIWQGVAIRQTERDFYGHPVALDLIHELGFQSMPMEEFLEFLSHISDTSLRLLPSDKDSNYVVGGISAWYITFHNS